MEVNGRGGGRGRRPVVVLGRLGVSPTWVRRDLWITDPHANDYYIPKGRPRIHRTSFSCQLSLSLSFLFLSLSLSMSLFSLSLSLFVCLSISQPFSLSLSQSLSVSIFLSVSLFLHVCLSLSLSVSLCSLCLFLSEYLSLCLFLNLSLIFSLAIQWGRFLEADLDRCALTLNRVVRFSIVVGRNFSWAATLLPFALIMRVKRYFFFLLVMISVDANFRAFLFIRNAGRC